MILGILLALAGTPAQSSNCSYNRTAMLAMDLDTFDQSEKGWRTIGQKSGCEGAAISAIRDYLAAHPNLSSDQKNQLLWHEGQLLAVANRYGDSLTVFSSIRETEDSQRLYQAATIAFLRRDKNALLNVRTKLASLPKPPDFDAAAKAFHDSTGQTISWPANLDVVDGLMRCFNNSYRVAYSDKCRH